MWVVTKVHTTVGEMRSPVEQRMEKDERNADKRNLRTKKEWRSERGLLEERNN